MIFQETDEGMFSFPFNWIVCIGATLGLLAILWVGLGLDKDLTEIWNMILHALGVA